MTGSGEPGPLSCRTIPQLVDAAARAYADDVFLAEGDRRDTFADVRATVRDAARAFIASGLQPGDRVAIWAQNCADWVIACLGLQYAGGVLVPVNTRYLGGEAADLLARSRAHTLVTTAGFLGKDYVRLLRETGAPLPDLRQIVRLGAAAETGSQPWDDFLRQGHGVSDQVLAERRDAVGERDLSDIIFTSGTTGRPKGVMLDHGQTLRITGTWNQMLGVTRGDRYLILNPFFHVFGYKYGWLCSLLAGVTVYPVATFDPAAMIDLVERERITILPGQPTVFRGLLDVPDLKSRDISSLRLSVIGSTSVPPAIVGDMHDVLGIDHVVGGYGLTESNGEITLGRFDDDLDTVAHTVGRPIEGVEVRIVAPDGTEVPIGDEGEIVCRGYNVMHGYLDDPAATAAVIDGDGWLHTGDIGSLDGQGSLRITGRRKDIFIVGGFNVAPAEVEAELLKHPAIRDVAVVGAADPRLGEVGVAFVVLAAGQQATPEDVIAWCRGRLANFKVPRRIVVVDQLPYNSTGKIQKEQLRERLLQ
jgi:HIP---CoA ligase